MNTRLKIASNVVVCVLTASLGVAAFTTFNAQATNFGSAFRYGRLVLSETAQTGEACLSTGSGTTDVNVSAVCDRLLDLSPAKPGDSAVAKLTLRNAGTLDASRLELFARACTDVVAPGESYGGTGSPCAALRFYVQRWADASFATPAACLYGGADGATCNFGDETKTLRAFSAAYSSSEMGLAIGGGLAARASVYITVGVELPSTAGNAYQGRAASFDLGWHLVQ